MPQLKDHPVRRGPAGIFGDPHFPKRFCRFQLIIDAPALEEQTAPPGFQVWPSIAEESGHGCKGAGGHQIHFPGREHLDPAMKDLQFRLGHPGCLPQESNLTRIRFDQRHPFHSCDCQDKPRQSGPAPKIECGSTLFWTIRHKLKGIEDMATPDIF
jgi:hypothetical protein